MPKLVLEPTATAQWQALVHEAEAACNRRLGEPLESYLVFLLQRFMDQPQLLDRVMALEYLRALEAQGRLQQRELQSVGDQCLLFSGLFPKRAQRRLVRVSYFVRLGRSAYEQLAGLAERGRETLYTELSQAFVPLMDVLLAMRELDGRPALTPLQAVELWQDTGSERALKACQGEGKLLAFPRPRRH